MASGMLHMTLERQDRRKDATRTWFWLDRAWLSSEIRYLLRKNLPTNDFQSERKVI